MAKHVIPVMLEGGGGVIVNTASGAGMQAEVVRAAYGTSKAAVIGFTRNVATQYGKLGIRCVAVVPGLTMTKTVAANMPPPMIEMMRRHHLTPEIATPEDIANAIVFLASDRAAFITGSVIPVDGGFSVHSPSYADEMAMYAAGSGAAAAAWPRASAAPWTLGGTTLQEADVAAVDSASSRTAPSARRQSRRRRRYRRLGQRRDRQPLERARRPGAGRLARRGRRGLRRQHARDRSARASPRPRAQPEQAISQVNVFHLNMGAGDRACGLFRPTLRSRTPSRRQAVEEHPNVAQFRAAEEARARNDFEADDLAVIERFLRPDVHWNSPWGVGPSIERRGDRAVQGVQGVDRRDDDARAERGLRRRHARRLARAPDRRPCRQARRAMDVKEANVFHLDDKGRAYEFWGIADDQAAINRFWTD